MRNIVLVTLDSLRADHCSFMGYHRKTTPNLDEMAEKGIYFKRAYSPSPRTLTSISSIFLGTIIQDYVDCNSMESLRENVISNLNAKKTIGEKLSEKGYTTGAFNPNAYASRYFGLDKGFDYFEDFFFEEDKFKKFFSGGKLAEVIRNLSNLLRRKEVFLTWDRYYHRVVEWTKSVNEPFFLWIFMLDTHFPYVTPWNEIEWTNVFEMYYRNYKLYNYINKRSHPSKNEIRKMVNIYDNSIHYADKFFGRITKDLKKFDPIYIVTSDHGEAFFEKGYFGHYFPYLYEENIHVPLVIYNLNENNKVVSKPSSLLDLSNLIITISKTKDCKDVDVERIFGGKPVVAKGIGYRRRIRRYCVISNNWKYMKILRNGISEEKLYNIRNNLIVDFPKVADNLRRWLDKEMKPDKKGNEEIKRSNQEFSSQKKEIEKRLRRLGYLG